jgi:hypothetical protein
VRLLELGDVDYAQLRDLLSLTRGSALRPQEWSRYDLRDLACLKAAIDLCGGPEALKQGRRLRLAPLRRAIEALKSAGFSEPLLDAGLHTIDRRLVATSTGVTFDAATGQLVLDFVQQEAVQYLEENVLVADFAAVKQVIAFERRTMRRRAVRGPADLVWSVEVVGVQAR